MQVATAALSFRGVAKTFPDGTTALTDIDLTVAAGDFVTVVGPSGCGKSTLLRIASGLDPATSGETNVPFFRVGYVFQDATLLPWRTVQRNVELLAELQGVPRRERAAAAKAATLGNVDLDRIQEVLDIVTPIYEEQGTPVADGLTPEDLVTNEFIDESIGLE